MHFELKVYRLEAPSKWVDDILTATCESRIEKEDTEYKKSRHNGSLGRDFSHAALRIESIAAL